jgi:hypothetical protein
VSRSEIGGVYDAEGEGDVAKPEEAIGGVGSQDDP